MKVLNSTTIAGGNLLERLDRHVEKGLLQQQAVLAFRELSELRDTPLESQLPGILVLQQDLVTAVDPNVADEVRRALSAAAFATARTQLGQCTHAEALQVATDLLSARYCADW